MLKLRSYVLIALAVYLVTVISDLPATLAMKPFEKPQGKGFQIESVSGSIWDGQAELMLQNRLYSLSWDVKPANLLLLKLKADLRIKSALLDAKGNLEVGFSSIKLGSFSGLLRAETLNGILKEQGVLAKVENDFYLQNINLSRSKSVFIDADGLITWDGGIVKSKALSGGQAVFPPMDAKLAPRSDGFVVDVTIKGGEESLLVTEVSNDGKADVKIKERVSQFINVPKELQRDNPDNIIFEIKRQIFVLPGGM